MPFGKGEPCVRVYVGGAGLVGFIFVRVGMHVVAVPYDEPRRLTDSHAHQPHTVNQPITQGYDEYWVLEVHYNNPEERAGLRDATGMEARVLFCFIRVC